MAVIWLPVIWFRLSCGSFVNVPCLGLVLARVGAACDQGPVPDTRFTLLEKGLTTVLFEGALDKFHVSTAGGGTRVSWLGWTVAFEIWILLHSATGKLHLDCKDMSNSPQIRKTGPSSVKVSCPCR